MKITEISATHIGKRVSVSEDDAIVKGIVTNIIYATRVIHTFNREVLRISLDRITIDFLDRGPVSFGVDAIILVD